MDQAMVDVFEQARKVVAEEDRKIAEEAERRKESEREKLRLLLGARIEEAFDFTSKEKLELEPRLDVQEGAGVVEFVVRSVRAIFLLSPGDSDMWTLQVVEDGREAHVVGEFKGGLKAEQASRRLAAARIVTAVGNWVQNVKGSNGNIQNNRGSQAVANTRQQPARLQAERDETRPEPTYGTMGKFLGC
jgi:hypothetical protein